jgi:molecular chaperone GrpE
VDANDQFAASAKGDGPDSDQQDSASPKRRDTDAASEPDEAEKDLSAWADEELADAEGSAGDRDEGAADDEVSVELVRDNVVQDNAHPKRKKRKKVKQKDEARRTPSHQEILERLLEKNEMIMQLNRQNVQLEAKQKALEDKRLRLVAEFENYRKRTRKEWELLKQQSRAEVILEILAVVDDFERAFGAAGKRDDDFVQGIRLIYNNLIATLARFDVSKMEALQTPFDPKFHMAVSQIESDKVESNHVVEVVLDGYIMGDTVIRPAKVVIAK